MKSYKMYLWDVENLVLVSKLKYFPLVSASFPQTIVLPFVLLSSPCLPPLPFFLKKPLAAFSTASSTI